VTRTCPSDLETGALGAGCWREASSHFTRGGSALRFPALISHIMDPEFSEPACSSMMLKVVP
jgi:hypothetical protein